MIIITMVTAPRQNQPTIERSLESLREAGVKETVHIFAEPDSFLPNGEGLVIHQHHKKVGSFVNHCRAMQWAFDGAYAADTIICLEDDVLFCRSFREKFLNRVGFATDHGMAIGLTHEWTVKAHHPYLAKTSGWSSANPGFGMDNIHGAQCYGFRPEDLWLVLDAPYMRQCRDADNQGKDMYFIDNIIVVSAWQQSVPVWLHVPSLCQHIGGESYFFAPDDRSDPLKDRRGFLYDPTY